MMNLHRLPTALLLLITLATSTLSAQTSVTKEQQESFNSNARKILTVLQAINEAYVDSINNDQIAEDAIIGMLNELDPHSAYTSAEEVAEMMEPLQGSFEGVGIQFNMLTDTLYVVQVIAGGPSERVGIRAGDRMIFVGDTLIAGVKQTNSDILKRLRGKKGTMVDVKIKRRGEEELISFRITRDKIPINSLDAAYMLTPEVGYIRLNNFSATTLEETTNALDKLTAQGMQHVILDLQSNGGGYLSAAIELSSIFLDRGKLVVYTKGRTSPKREALSTGGRFNDKRHRLVVLTDQYSASASEIVSGAMQDWDRGIIVGRRTFGKGLVQSPLPLADGSMIRLTTARYYTPAGRSIQKPYEHGENDQYQMETYDRYMSGELMHSDSIHFADSLRYNTLISGRTVYGGGGIMPDRFVPLDTTKYTDWHRDISAKGIVQTVSMNYADLHRKTIARQYETLNAFINNYTTPTELFDELIAEGKKEKIEATTDEIERARPMVNMILKALVGRELFGMESYYQLINKEDDILQQGLEIILDPTRYHKLLQSNK